VPLRQLGFPSRLAISQPARRSAERDTFSGTNIGHPKLFIGWAVGRQESAAALPVNNFVAAEIAP